MSDVRRRCNGLEGPREVAETKVDSDLVERVVREVIRRLLAGGHDVTRDNKSTSSPSQRALDLTDRIVTLATLKGKLDGVSQLTVARRAVVTPSVRDELNRRRIELRRN